MPVGRRLLGGQIAQPVAQEAVDVEEVRGGGREGGDVTGPAEPLVALGAVGGNVEEVAARAPDHVAVQLVEQLVGTLELSGPAQIGGDDDGAQIIGGQIAGPALDLDVAEAVEREGRLEEVAVTAQDEPIRRRGSAQRPHAEFVVLEHLGVPQGDLGAGRPLDLEAQPAHEILAEVDQRLAGGRGPDR